jgi:hypothetical protein
MSATYYGQPRALTLADRVVDSTKPGSVMSQALTGAVGLVLALVLIGGQISLATTKGISENLHKNVQQLKDGNKTMASVIERAEPSVAMEATLGAQADSLGNTERTMGLLNKEMATSGKVTDDLMSTVARMQSTSGLLANSVGAMNYDSLRMLDLLQMMPASTQHTYVGLNRIGGDTKAINGEMQAITAKMRRYGLTPAHGVLSQ